MTPAQKREERIKLAANCLNIVSAGCLIGAIVTAPLTWLMRAPPADPFPLTFVGICVMVVVLTHFVAQLVLGRL